MPSTACNNLVHKWPPSLILGAGAFLTVYTAAVLSPAAIFFPLCSLLVFLFSLRQKKKNLLRKIGLLFFLGTLLGLSAYWRTGGREEAVLPPGVDFFEGIILADSTPYRNGGFVHYLELCHVGSSSDGYSQSARGRVLLVHPGGEKAFRGALVKARGKLSPLDQGEYAFISYPPGPLEIKGYRGFFSFWRRTWLKRMDHRLAFLEPSSRGLFMALFLGAREELDSGLRMRFEESGTLHLLALSGLHVGILYFLLMIMLKPVKKIWIRFFLFSFILGGYLFFTGLSPSLFRAALMLWLAELSRLLDREIIPLNIVALSGLIILIADPASLFTLSFALSYLAVLGIFLIGFPLHKRLQGILPPFLSAPVSLSLGAQIGTAAPVIAGFGILYPGGLGATLVLVPLITLYLYLGILALVFGSAGYIGLGLEWLYGLISRCAGAFTQVPGLAFEHRTFFTGAASLFFISLIFFPSLDKLRRIRYISKTPPGGEIQISKPGSPRFGLKK